MFENWKNFYFKYKETIDYLFFGGLTTAVNILTFFILDSVVGMYYLHANAIAIILSILFAYVTNKLFVFESFTEGFQETLREFLRFITFRLITGVMDMIALWILADLIGIENNIAKLLTQFIVVFSNYFFSKFFIFIK